MKLYYFFKNKYMQNLILLQNNYIKYYILGIFIDFSRI